MGGNASQATKHSANDFSNQSGSFYQVPCTANMIMNSPQPANQIVSVVQAMTGQPYKHATAAQLLENAIQFAIVEEIQ